jgi:hypothetical protein
MAFSVRIFCRDQAVPSVSETVMWLHQHGRPVTLDASNGPGGAGVPGLDMLSSLWDRVQLSYDADEAPLTVRCLRADAAGIGPLREELADFEADVRELPPSRGRELVLAQLGATRALVIVEQPAEGVSALGQETTDSIAALFVERSNGMVQRDGSGFHDEDDDLVLALG